MDSALPERPGCGRTQSHCLVLKRLGPSNSLPSRDLHAHLAQFWHSAGSREYHRKRTILLLVSAPTGSAPIRWGTPSQNHLMKPGFSKPLCSASFERRRGALDRCPRPESVHLRFNCNSGPKAHALRPQTPASAKPSSPPQSRPPRTRAPSAPPGRGGVAQCRRGGGIDAAMGIGGLPPYDGPPIAVRVGAQGGLPVHVSSTIPNAGTAMRRTIRAATAHGRGRTHQGRSPA